MILDIFRDLTSVPTAPYYEAAVTKRALRWTKGFRVSRRRGGVIVRYVGNPGAPALCLAAHLDHPAFHLNGGKVELMGGLPPHLLEGADVEAFPAAPRDNRAIGRGKVRKGWQIDWETKPKGAAFATLALTPCTVRAGWVESRSIDDLMGCAISLAALHEVRRKRMKTNLTVLLHRAEEVGFIGALDLIHEKAVSLDDTVLSIETSRAMPGATPGKGPVIRLGDKACVFDGNATALLEEAAKGRKVQRLRLTGGTCEATAYLAFGYEAGGLAIPLVNYHNGWGADAVSPEKVRLSDAQGAVALLVRAAELFPKATLRGAMRRRLAQRHAGHKFGRIAS